MILKCTISCIILVLILTMVAGFIDNSAPNANFQKNDENHIDECCDTECRAGFCKHAIESIYDDCHLIIRNSIHWLDREEALDFCKQEDEGKCLILEVQEANACSPGCMDDQLSFTCAQVDLELYEICNFIKKGIPEKCNLSFGSNLEDDDEEDEEKGCGG